MKRFITFFLFGLMLMVSGCSQMDSSAKLHTLFDEAWNFQLQENPLFATSVGHHESNDRLPSMTLPDLERRVEFWRDVLNRLHTLDRSGLGETDRINYDIFEYQVKDNIANFEFKAYTMPFTAESGFHTGFARLPNRVPLATVQDYENYIKRLHAWPDYVHQQIALIKEGISIGMTQPKVVLAGFEITMKTHVVDDPAKSVFYKPFERFPATITKEEQIRLLDAGRSAITEAVVPGYRDLLSFFVNEYVPNARESIGASHLPNGRKYYEQRVQYYTTLDMGLEEIHELGLKEVARIRKEMDEIIKEVGFTGDFAGFLHFLRTAPQFYAKTPQELLKEASYIAKKIDGKLPSLFKTLPRLPYGVAPVPAHIAPKYTTGRYVGPALGSTEPGYYWVNTYALESRPLYNLESLTLHEAVPGHHLQNAIARELTNLPNFRRFSYISAFGEGWGLYCEWLGLEAGFYTDPYSNFGRLTYEMWRACRLVVDTGMHALGWTRQQTLDYLASNTALPLHEIKTETDRYISWPGQALSYKIGELKIKALRRKAEEILGKNFDIREFHDVILRNGSVPLKVLEELVGDWIEEKRAG
ncbi:MAG: DUF885 family protein [bacterium]